jgi:hypothetical protein
MAGKGRANFDEPARLIEADPVRMARLADAEASAVAERLSYSLNETASRRGSTPPELPISQSTSGTRPLPFERR